MSLVRALMVLGIGLMVFGLFSPRPAAQAAPAPGENTQEIALKRWQDNQPRHWRHTLTRR